MEGVPTGAVVETNALLTGDQIQPVVAGAFPPDVQSLTIRHIYNQETILRAALKKDVNLAFRAFLHDPLVQIDPQQAEELFTRMVISTKEYLPGWVIPNTK
jgi:alpha-galactosidase